MPFDFKTKIDTWQANLLDTSKRNRLVNFKSGRTGGINLVHPDAGDLWESLVVRNSSLSFAWQRELIDLPSPPDNVSSASDSTGAARKEATPDVLARCRNSPRLRPEHILTDLTDSHLATRLTRIALTSRESITEQGVATLFIAFGFLRWFESIDSETEIRSPLLLVPVRLERASIEAPWRLQADEEDVLPNHSLVQLMTNNFRLRLPIPEDEGLDAADVNQRLRYFGEIQRCVRHYPRWEVKDEVALGIFNFQKLAMWEDLERSRDRIGQHDLCRAIAGDPQVELRSPGGLPEANELDRITHPAKTFHILDADSSQHEAIEAAKRGASLVLDGPPGTGKSQTIANIIAEFLADGKTVLFVSEKAAALEVVQRRLREKKLDDFVLACHSHKANKREVIAELGRCLKLMPDNAADPSEDLERLSEARQALNAYVRELHTVRQPLGMTVYQVHGELCRLARVASKSRCPIPRILERDAAYLRRTSELLARLPDCQNVIADRDHHPWRGCRATVYSLNFSDDISHHLKRLSACLGDINEAVAVLHSLGFSNNAPMRKEWLASVGSARAILACPLVPPTWFVRDSRMVAQAVIQMDDLTKTYQRRRAAVPEFPAASLPRADLSLLSGLTLGSHEFRLIPREGDSARTIRGRLEAVTKSLKELRTQAAAADQAAKRVGELLGLSLHAVPVKRLPRIVELAELAGRAGPIRRSWWNEERRKELQAIFARCQKETRVAQETRTAFAARISPVAFAPENGNLVIEASGYQSFLAQLWPRWWSVLKPAVIAWYPGQSPPMPVLQEDLLKLASYHRTLDYSRQVREQYADELVFGSDGVSDWGSALEALRVVDRMLQITKVPTSLQILLSSEKGLDRSALAVAAKELARAARSLREKMDAVAAEYLLDETARERFTALGLVEWVDKETSILGRQTAILTHVVSLLEEGRDVSATALPNKVHVLYELGNLRAQVAACANRIWSDRPPAEVEDHDWSVLCRTADSLLGLLGRLQGAPTSPLVRALTAPDVRSKLESAVRQSDQAAAAGFAESWEFLAGLFNLNHPISTGITIEAAPLSEVRRWVAERTKDVPRLLEWIQFCEVAREAQRADVGTILKEVLEGQVKPEEASAAFRARCLGLWLHDIYEGSPALRQFAADSHERLIDMFKELDRRAVSSASARIRAKQLSRPDRPRAIAGEAPGSSELGTLLREVNKKRRHLSLRKLFAAIPTMLTRLKPCLMMSPLAVSTYLETREIHFDLVIFDEASQVRPHDAICAIYRGRQLIVAGDQRQLPPTNFFQRAQDDEDDGESDDGIGGLEDFESILDVCCTLGLLHRRLRWHYRSRREGLIAFANRLIYGNELITFPSVYDVPDNPAVTLEFVSDGRWKSGKGGGFNTIEARRTAELVLTHFREHPDESLGVIAFGQRHQVCILDELERLRKASPDMESFFREDRDEPFFVKNLENVQGDERDAIVLGVGYGHLETGQKSVNFGPVNRAGGERRLNVAVTRARQRMTVVSSIRAQDIDPRRSSARGVELFRAYLDYAERGIKALPAIITGVGEPDFEHSPLEKDVYEELTRRGLTIHTQVGCSGYRIDLAIVAPQTPGRYLLGVECDGATYHSSATARDRDRLRQDVLERLGWCFCRIWSTDWLRDREGQIRRVQVALEKAQREESAPRSTVKANPPPQVKKETTTTPVAPVDPPTLAFASIDEVPELILRQTCCRELQKLGAIEPGELVQTVARQLGFKRTGNRIQARIESCLEGLIQSGHIRRAADGRLMPAIAPRTAAM